MPGPSDIIPATTTPPSAAVPKPMSFGMLLGGILMFSWRAKRWLS